MSKGTDWMTAPGSDTFSKLLCPVWKMENIGEFFFFSVPFSTNDLMKLSSQEADILST